MPNGVKEFLYAEEGCAKEEFYKKAEEIKYITSKMSKAQYPFLILKGLGMAETVYKENPYIRDFNDIDILVKEEEADEIYAYFLEDIGYACEASIGEQLVYKKFFQHYAPICRDGVYVEMHHRLTQEDDPYRINTKRIMNSADIIYLGDTSIYIPNKTDMLINLCYHLFQHEYRESRFMLKPYSDIYNFLYCYQDTFEWDTFVKYVKNDNIEFPITYSLYFVNMLYREIFCKDIVPIEILELLMPADFDARKDSIISRHLFNGDAAIGTWAKPHMERLFMEAKDLRRELCRKYFFYVSERHWKEECDKLNIPFEENFEFSPRAWEKYGRI